MALVGFCSIDTNLKVELEKKKIYLSQIFQWYRGDFARSEAELLKFLAEKLPEDKKSLILQAVQGNFSISYTKYDWSVNGNASSL